MLTMCAHKEGAEHGLRVMGLSPGTVATDMQHEIKVRRQVQNLIVGADMRCREMALPDFRPGCHDANARKPSVNLCQPILHLINGDLVQGLCEADFSGALTVQRKRSLINQPALAVIWGRGCGGGFHGRYS